MKPRRRWTRRLLLPVVALLLLCGGTLLLSAVYNQTLPTASPVVERLSAAEKARVAEIFHLRETVGDDVWPGWGSADLPVIVYNESYAFLIGYPDPPPGWRAVPDMARHGGPWEVVPDDKIDGQPYYRQPLPADGTTPQGFTVLVGDHWVGSMQTWEWMQVSFRQQLQSDMPPFIAPLVPYAIIQDLFIDGSDMYLSLLAHELFHAYQGTAAADRLVAAEEIMRVDSGYPWDDPALEAAWQAELDLLLAALESDDDAETAALAEQFLAQRGARREAAGLSPAAVSLERQREWLEGLGRYAELEIWRLAAENDYAPLPAMASVDDFDGYADYAQRWGRELDQIPRMAGDDGDGRFYYSGMAQAVLLDRLDPAWKETALSDGGALEDLLAAALTGRSTAYQTPISRKDSP